MTRRQAGAHRVTGFRVRCTCTADEVLQAGGGSISPTLPNAHGPKCAVTKDRNARLCIGKGGSR